MSTAEIIERERRWATPVGLATLLAVALIVAGFALNPVSGDGAAEVLQSADEHASAVINVGLLQALGFFLLLPPLVYLHSAAAARSERMRSQFIGLAIAAPLFLGAFSIIGAQVTRDAAESFISGSVEPDLSRESALSECRSQLSDDGESSFREEYGARNRSRALAECTGKEVADDTAEVAIRESSLTPLATGLGFAGRLALAVSLFYTCLHAMRAGLLSRFWGALGMALAVFAGFFALPFVAIWFMYFGLLTLGWVLGGRPPAWAAGEAAPWPTPGERAAESMEREGPDDEEDEPRTAPEPASAPEGGEASDQPATSPRRKRKRRS